MSRLREDVAAHVPLRILWRTEVAPQVPAVVAAALCHAAREALTNVVRHAGVDEATVSVRRDDRGAVVVEVCDDGAGFDPERVLRHHYGVTRSLVARMARTGGHTRITSRPGRGTAVRMECPSGGADDNTELIATNFLRGLRWAAIGTTLAVLFGLQVPVVLANRESYTSFTTQVVAIAVFASVALVVAAWQGQLGPWRWPLVGVVFAASVAATAGGGAGAPVRDGALVLGHGGWPLVLLTLGSGAGVVAGLLAAHYA